MKPCGKKNAGTQKDSGRPLYSQLPKNSTLKIKSATHVLKGLRDGYPTVSHCSGTLLSRNLLAIYSSGIDMTTVPSIAASSY
jgi:hypothetical protein